MERSGIYSRRIFVVIGILVVVFVLSLLVVVLEESQYLPPPAPPQYGSQQGTGETGEGAPNLAWLSTLIAGAGLITAFIFGWRNDRRAAREMELKMILLQRELERAIEQDSDS